MILRAATGLGIAGLLIFSSATGSSPAEPELKWRVPVGITNFKSTIITLDGTVYVGTRGHPAVTDVDGDGALELLVASRDGFLSCFATEVTWPVSWPYFHGSHFNDRVWKIDHGDSDR